MYGHYHREDGPAIEQVNGYKEWYLNDLKVTREHIVKLQRKRVTPITKIVFTYYSPVSVVYSRGLIRDLVPLIVNETYT